jgi:hypothetical protein
LEDLGVDGRIILKLILKKNGVMNWIAVVYDRKGLRALFEIVTNIGVP